MQNTNRTMSVADPREAVRGNCIPKRLWRPVKMAHIW